MALKIKEISLVDDKVGTVKSAAKTSTERSRLYRLANRKSGGAELSVFINSNACAALQVIRCHNKSTQTQAIEAALIDMATRYAADAAAVHPRFNSGPISALDPGVSSECGQRVSDLNTDGQIE